MLTHLGAMLTHLGAMLARPQKLEKSCEGRWEKMSEARGRWPQKLEKSFEGRWEAFAPKLVSNVAF